MVFCDLSTYKPGIWNVYSEIKRKLVEDHGIPAQEIRFVQEAASDKVRQAMFDAMNEGKIRVLFGSTQKLGTGVNAQQRIVAMHHLDIPWRPMDLEQRNGRGARKGNIVAKEYAGNKVKAYVYAVLRTLDAYKLNLLHNKQQFIDQLKRNRLGARRLDEGGASARIRG
ncbi:Helicase conserved C-terminal domain-containing protein [Alistipes timonensis JC136]|uniref:Helicase conserved C-terminal domain-containing protein n=1 Tax=Alistipes timonensis JC136 TaxID=1033731 RepID=A0A1H4D4F8_9BACT|nr:Helicase conserved C-terminal domain-containing protein [Alistipes timonensis JC136]